MAHRLAWLLHYGSWPSRHIDHINGDRADNRIANLRECDDAENQQNLRAATAASKSGLLGVTTRTYRNGAVRYAASIQVDGTKRYLGVYGTPEEAHSAYRAAKRQLHPFGTL